MKNDTETNAPEIPAETETSISTETFILPITLDDAEFLYDVLAYFDAKTCVDGSPYREKVHELIDRIRATGVGI